VPAVVGLAAIAVSGGEIAIRDAELLRLQPGDVLVIRVDVPPNVEQVAQLRDLLPSGVQIVVMPVGSSIEILQPHSGDA
jgi:hypothetical protein